MEISGRYFFTWAIVYTPESHFVDDTSGGDKQDLSSSLIKQPNKLSNSICRRRDNSSQEGPGLREADVTGNRIRQSHDRSRDLVREDSYPREKNSVPSADQSRC
ncbi:hypothetical protein CEK25_012543 [Fusarium fujikuroi]|nr:hypothetical protein CEK25_012543 [Fusarium fujikuroi]